MLQSRFFGANGDLRVAIGGLEADMSKPASDYIYLDTGFQQVDSGAVPPQMG